jgi:hypothetical protein
MSHLVCKACGGEEVWEAVWSNPNTGDSTTLGTDVPYCDDCGGPTRLVFADVYEQVRIARVAESRQESCRDADFDCQKR